MTIPITDPADPRVSAYESVRERDLAGRHGMFIAEGEVVLRLLLGRPSSALESVFLSETRHRLMAAALRGLGPDIPVYVASEAVMSRVVGFPIHRGVLAVGRRGPGRSTRELLAGCSANALVVGLIGIANHDNVGGVFRNAAAFGAEAVLLDRTCCDPLYRKAIRVSVGASLLVPFAQGGPADALVTDLACCDFEIVSLTPGGSLALQHVQRRGRTALLLGAEGAGLPPAVLARTRGVRIPMAAGFDSLNVATASGIALHHLAAVDMRHKHAAERAAGLDDQASGAISRRTD